MRLLLILCVITTNVFAQSDSTVNLSKKTALFYYQEHKRAEYLAHKNRFLEIKLDSTNKIVGEQKIQLGTYEVELEGQRNLNISTQIRLDVATTDIGFQKIKIGRLRRTKGLFIVTTCLSTAIAGYLVYKEVSD